MRRLAGGVAVSVAVVAITAAVPASTSAQPTTNLQAGQDAEPRTPIPPITDADRAAAFPDIERHPPHGNSVHYLVLFDQIEWQAMETGGGVNWDTAGWIGGDRNRLWFSSEGAGEDGRLVDAEAHLLYGRAFARWWDLVVGVRQDIPRGPAQTWAAVGVQGLAPYWFEVEATGYFSDRGQTAARLKAQYELLLTNRLVLQPGIEINLYGKESPERGIGAGLSRVETGLRVRYEFRRELAPYLGVMWENTFGPTADLAAVAGEQSDGPRLVAGVRLWF